MEYSHKYTDDSFEALLLQAGLQVSQRWDAESPAYGLRLQGALEGLPATSQVDLFSLL